MASQVARHWLQRLILAAYSPEFYRWVGVRRFVHPVTRNDVLFHSLPPEEQQKVHDQWQGSRPDQSVDIGRKEWQNLMDKATGTADEAEASGRDRREMAKRLKELRGKGLPPRILDKEKKRLVQEMESRRLQRKMDLDAA